LFSKITVVRRHASETVEDEPPERPARVGQVGRDFRRGKSGLRGELAVTGLTGRPGVEVVPFEEKERLLPSACGALLPQLLDGVTEERPYRLRAKVVLGRLPGRRHRRPQLSLRAGEIERQQGRAGVALLPLRGLSLVRHVAIQADAKESAEAAFMR